MSEVTHKSRRRTRRLSDERREELLRAGVEVFSARGFVTLTRGGIGYNGEARGIIDGVRAARTVGVMEGLPVDRPALRLAVPGWIGCLASIERGEPSRDEVAALARSQPAAIGG